ncbi:MAG: alanine dehydrogenase [Thermodesulfobacteriota bacterium]|nr:alanine dehydrogenase [Thermodesulfobacteriota bacterium]
MIVGVIKEIMADEDRVSLLPVGVELLVEHGHCILVEAGSGSASGFADEQYIQAGAEIISSPDEVYRKADMIMKVKEPLPVEYNLIKEEQIVFTYFHFAASETLTRAIIQSRCVAIAYETIETEEGHLPLLTPMSEVAGRMAVQQGAKYLECEHGGRGILLGGVPGVEPGTVVVIGGGVVGANAAKMAAGLGASVYILDTNLARLRYLSDVMPPNVVTMMSNSYNIRELIAVADVVISAVLIPGGKTPKLITRDMLALMKKGAVIVDVAIDQGGSLETSRLTTHENPIYEVDGVIHYCVGNMPGAVPMTSTIALTNATLPYAVEIADRGYKRSILNNPAIAKGVNIVLGKVTYKNVADAFGMSYTPVEEALGHR